MGLIAQAYKGKHDMTIFPDIAKPMDWTAVPMGVEIIPAGGKPSSGAPGFS